MDIMQLRELAEKCTRNDPAFCSAACPLGLDARALIAKLQTGAFTQAYKFYRSAVFFPAIVSRICDRPCERACALGDRNAAVAVRELERACCAYTEEKAETSYYINPRTKTIAVVGAGLGGLGCACKLAKRGYHVDVYDMRALPGGWLSAADDPELRQAAAEELARAVELEHLHFHPKVKINNLGELAADAVYLATGRFGDRFGLEEGWDAVTLATAQPGVYMSSAGRNGASTLTPLREGLLAADTLEAYVKVGRVMGRAGLYQPAATRLCCDAAGRRRGPRLPQEIKPRVDISAPGCYSKEEAVAEAGRCLLCSCSMCLDACPVLANYRQEPKKIIEDVNGTLNPIPDYHTHLASREINSCNMCGLCKQVCPRGLDFEEIFLDSRRVLHQQGVQPPAYHDFWLRDMRFSQSAQCYLAAGGKACRYLFFPGCQLGGSDPQYVAAGYAYLAARLAGPVGVLLSCCGAPARWAGREDEREGVSSQIRASWEQLGRPVLVMACPTCEKVLRSTLPELELLSLYSVMAKHGLPDAPGLEGVERITVFDPCASRDAPQTQRDVRRILGALQLSVGELPYGGEEARCCGYGGQVHAANRRLMETIAGSRAQDSPDDYLTYCANCREIFAGQGKPALHMLDLLLGRPLAERLRRRPAHLSEIRSNREVTKRLMAEKFALPAGEQGRETPEIFISDELLRKMDRDLIVRDDAEQVILACEAGGDKLVEQGSGHFIGHLQIGASTYWAKYCPEQNGFRLVNIYSHRMKLEEKSYE